ncbi:MAG: hypothetical protein AAF889_05155 [Cyanobacteria bacterium P01_D01_bin.73]
MSQDSALNKLAEILQHQELPQGIQVFQNSSQGMRVFTILVPDSAAEVPPPMPRSPEQHPDYNRFLPAKAAVKLMRNKGVNPNWLRQLARDASERRITGFEVGKHFNDRSRHGSVNGRWVFCPAAIDRWFELDPDKRSRPIRSRKRAS